LAGRSCSPGSRRPHRPFAVVADHADASRPHQGAQLRLGGRHPSEPAERRAARGAALPRIGLSSRSVRAPRRSPTRQGHVALRRGPGRRGRKSHRASRSIPRRPGSTARRPDVAYLGSPAEPGCCSGHGALSSAGGGQPEAVYRVRLSVRRVVGGRHWTRTSDLLHVKHRRLCVVLGGLSERKSREQNHAIKVVMTGREVQAPDRPPRKLPVEPATPPAHPTIRFVLTVSHLWASARH
jgi:hypothetical protein